MWLCVETPCRKDSFLGLAANKNSCYFFPHYAACFMTLLCTDILTLNCAFFSSSCSAILSSVLRLSRRRAVVSPYCSQSRLCFYISLPTSCNGPCVGYG